MLKSTRSRFLPLIVTAALCALGISLGNWQTQRALEKEQIAESLQQQSKLPPLNLNLTLSSTHPVSSEVNDGNQQGHAFRPVEMRGEFVRDWPLYLDNRPLYGVAGFYVLMPFKLEGSDKTVLVARGWLQRNVLERTKLPPLVTPTGIISLRGVIRDNLDRSMQLGQVEIPQPGAIVQNLTIDSLRARGQWNLWDKFVEQSSDVNDGLSRNWPK
ncbi:MAG: SURF1 family protein, partial [Burkholderiales bacterium]|nr:SURF1 family protein [Burkholderiales bacterium]